MLELAGWIGQHRELAAIITFAIVGICLWVRKQFTETKSGADTFTGVEWLVVEVRKDLANPNLGPQTLVLSPPHAQGGKEERHLLITGTSPKAMSFRGLGNGTSVVFELDPQVSCANSAWEHLRIKSRR